MYRKILLCTIAFIISFLIVFRLGNYYNSSSNTQNFDEINFESQQKNDEFDSNKIKVLSWNPRVFLYPKFISDEDCDHIIKLGENKLSRSLVGDGKLSPYRTSYGVFLKNKDPILESIEEKISVWTQLQKENGESFYLLRYEIGQEYKAHPDYFHPSQTGKSGNRFATVLIYLSDVEEGGETFFPKVNLEIKPKKGDAILFWNLHVNGTADTLSLHGAKPVLKGTKWCMTKWIRQFKYH